MNSSVLSVQSVDGLICWEIKEVSPEILYPQINKPLSENADFFLFICIFLLYSIKKFINYIIWSSEMLMHSYELVSRFKSDLKDKELQKTNDKS